MTNQNSTSPALHHQNQPPDSGSVHESQRRQLRLSLLAVTATHAVCVFVLECFPISEERRGEASTTRPPATKSPFLLMMTNQNTTSPAPHHQNQPPDFGSVHESQQQQLRLSLHRSHRHTCCVRARRVFYNFPWREAAQLMCLAALITDLTKHWKDAQGFPAQGLHHHGPRYFNFPYFCTMCGLEKLGIVDQNWLERICPICC